MCVHKHTGMTLSLALSTTSLRDYHSRGLTVFMFNFIF